MKYPITVSEIVPWSEYNEYEGHIVGFIGGREFCIYAMVGLEDRWGNAKSGDVVEADVYLERYGDVTIMPQDSQLFLAQKRGVNYRAVYKVESMDGDILQVSCGDMAMTVDLDLTIHTPKVASVPPVAVGMVIGVDGVLSARLED